LTSFNEELRAEDGRTKKKTIHQKNKQGCASEAQDLAAAAVREEVHGAFLGNEGPSSSKLMRRL
jgi:hypothetical protein